MLDHLVYATPDIDGTVEELAGRLGVRASAGGRHLDIGTRNALLSFGGGAYFEVIGIDGAAAGPAGGLLPFGLDRITAPRLVTWAAHTDKIDEHVARARDLGYDPGPIRPMSRKTPDGAELSWRLTPPGAEVAELVPFLIDWGVTPHPSTTSATGCRLVHFAGEHPDPDMVRSALAALGVELEITGAPEPTLIALIEGPAGTIELR